jgi:hypothetical protein
VKPDFVPPAWLGGGDNTQMSAFVGVMLVVQSDTAVDFGRRLRVRDWRAEDTTNPNTETEQDWTGQ